MRNILFLIQSHFWQLSGQLHFLFFPQRRCQSTDEKEEVFFLAWSIFVLIVKTLSLNHQAKPLPKSLGIVIWSDPLPQGREVPEWLCLSAQPEMCLSGQNDVAPRWPKPGLSLVSAPGSSDQGIIHSPFYSPATLKGNIQGCQQLITADITADQSCRITPDIGAVAQELLPLSLLLQSPCLDTAWAALGDQSSLELHCPLGYAQGRPEGPKRSLQPPVPPSAVARSSHPQDGTGQVCDACLLSSPASRYVQLSQLAQVWWGLFSC